MSEFWMRKLRTYFSKIDVNNDGFISKRDAEEMAEHLADSENLSPEQRTQIVDNFVELWRQFTKSVGSDDAVMTPSILIASIDQQRNDPEFKETYYTLCYHMFRVRDTNGDGFLSEDEYAQSFALVGIQDTSFVNSAFEYIDLNKDGKLDLVEYTTALYKYLTTEDEHLLWGPLVD